MDNSGADLKAPFQNLDQLWNPADLPASEAAFRALLPDAERESGKSSGSNFIELLSLIGRTEALQQKFAQAHASLDQAEKLLNEQQASYRLSAKIRWLIERGRLHILEKTPYPARKLFSEAWTLAINSGEDYFAVEIAQLLATTEPQKVQQEWIMRAIKIAEESPLQKTKLWLGGLYTNLGWKFYDLREYEMALGSFQTALRHHKATGTAREAFVSQWSIGKVLRALGRTEEALAIQKGLLSELGIGGARDGRLYEELAECLQVLQRTTEAQIYFELAYRELSNDEWITDNQPLKLKRLKDLGKVK
jgi:tetratricopeptide (TPR) repeat protein